MAKIIIPLASFKAQPSVFVAENFLHNSLLAISAAQVGGIWQAGRDYPLAINFAGSVFEEMTTVTNTINWQQISDKFIVILAEQQAASAATDMLDDEDCQPDSAIFATSAEIVIKIAAAELFTEQQTLAKFLLAKYLKVNLDNSVLLRAGNHYPINIEINGMLTSVVFSCEQSIICRHSMHKDKWSLDIVDCQLGSGASATVYATKTLNLLHDNFFSQPAKKRVAKIFHEIIPKDRIWLEYNHLCALQDDVHKPKMPVVDKTNNCFEKIALLMPRAFGETLQKILQKDRAGELLTLQQILTIILGVLNAAEKLSKQEIVHRDLKPANILCDLNRAVPTITIFDLELSARIGEKQLGSVGTPGYFAPINGDTVAVSADCFSLAVILGQLLRTPYLDYASIGGNVDEGCRGLLLACRLIGYQFQDVLSTPDDFILNEAQRFVIRKVIAGLGALQPSDRISLAIAIFAFEKIASELGMLAQYQPCYLVDQKVAESYKLLITEKSSAVGQASALMAAGVFAQRYTAAKNEQKRYDKSGISPILQSV